MSVDAKSTVGLTIVLLCIACAPPALAKAQGQGAARPAADSGSRPVATAVQAAEAPMVDGVLDDRVWQNATPLTNFVQAEPLEGQPASESTEVRIVYDAEAIYVGVVLHDSDPSQIVTTDTRRDAGLGEMDSFQIIFDTYRDQQNGFVFGTNAAGIQYDAQVRNQGNASSSWDGSWDVRTTVTETGWTAEFRIPLRTLRYGPAPQVWGLNFFRNIQRTRERTYWAPLAQEYNLGRLSSAGERRPIRPLAVPLNVAKEVQPPRLRRGPVAQRAQRNPKLGGPAGLGDVRLDVPAPIPAR